MINFETHGKEINRLHHLAHQMASDAITNARTAGILLLEVKQAMKHGKFLHWVRDNVQVSLRQAQRYMAVAEGKTIPLRRLIEKNDTVSHLTEVVNGGIWKKGLWEPERGYTYIFNEDEADYWVTPSKDQPMGFHVCKHYQGKRIPSVGFHLRYTVLAEEAYNEIPNQNYIGTKRPIHLPQGVEGVLRSYGLKDLKSTLVFSILSKEGDERPHAEPTVDCWYWDEGIPDYELFIECVKPINHPIRIPL